MFTYQGVNFLTARELMTKSKASFSKKTFEFMRDTLRLIPKPLKVASDKGRGTIGYYPESLVQFIKRIEVEHRKGLSYANVAKQLVNEAKKNDELAITMQKAFEAEKMVRSQLAQNLTISEHPQGRNKRFDIVLQLSDNEKVFVEIKTGKSRGAKMTCYRLNGSQFTALTCESNEKELQALMTLLRATQNKICTLFEK